WLGQRAAQPKRQPERHQHENELEVEAPGRERSEEILSQAKRGEKQNERHHTAGQQGKDEPLRDGSAQARTIGDESGDQVLGLHGWRGGRAMARPCGAGCRATRTAPSLMPSRCPTSRALWPSIEIASTIRRWRSDRQASIWRVSAAAVSSDACGAASVPA